MPVGTGKIGLFGGVSKPIVQAGSQIFNSPGTFQVPEGLEVVSLTGVGSTSNAGNPGNPGGSGPGGAGGPGGFLTWPSNWNGSNASNPNDNAGVGCGQVPNAAGNPPGGPGNPGNPGGPTSVFGLNWTGGAVGNGGAGGVNGFVGTPGSVGRSYTNTRLWCPCNGCAQNDAGTTGRASGGSGAGNPGSPTIGGFGSIGWAVSSQSNKFPGVYGNTAKGGGGGGGAPITLCNTPIPCRSEDGGKPSNQGPLSFCAVRPGGTGQRNSTGTGGYGGSSSGCASNNQDPGTPGRNIPSTLYNYDYYGWGGGGGGGGGAVTAVGGFFCTPGVAGARASGGGGGGGYGSNGNSGSGAGNPGSAGNPSIYNCVPVVTGCYPVSVGTGGQITISWNTQ